MVQKLGYFMVNEYLRTGAGGQTNSSMSFSSSQFFTINVESDIIILIMRILGVGVDLIENARMLKLIQKDNFLRKVLHPSEINKFHTISTEEGKVQYLASRWATKEAIIKAVGRTNLYFHEMHISHNQYGRPILELTSLHNREIIQQLNISTIHISISHESTFSMGYAIAMEKII